MVRCRCQLVRCHRPAGPASRPTSSWALGRVRCSLQFGRVRNTSNSNDGECGAPPTPRRASHDEDRARDEAGFLDRAQSDRAAAPATTQEAARLPGWVEMELTSRLPSASVAADRLGHVLNSVGSPSAVGLFARRASAGAYCLTACGCGAGARHDESASAGYTIHQLRNNARVYSYSAANPPGKTVRSGDVIEVQCLDASDGWLGPEGPESTTEHYAKRRHTPEIMEKYPGNPVCEPVYVEGAEPGDTLVVEILELRTADWGWTGVRRGFGLLEGDPLLTEDRLRVWKLHPDTREPCELADTGIKVPCRPFCGCMGVAPPPDEQWEAGQPPGVVSIGPPNINGGNIDTKHLVEGAKVLLPVFVQGALFSCGDGHAAQGDGEVCGSAIETHMWVRVRLSVIKLGSQQSLAAAPAAIAAAGVLPPKPSAPRLQYITPGSEVGLPGPHYATTGVGPDLFAAAREAVAEMVRWLVANQGLDPCKRSSSSDNA